MGWLTDHPRERGYTYAEHAGRALRVSGRLALASIFFFIHALIPAVKVTPSLNFTAMAQFLADRNMDRPPR